MESFSPAIVDGYSDYCSGDIAVVRGLADCVHVSK